MGHPPFPWGATPREIRAVKDLHRVADRHEDREVRETPSGAPELIAERIREHAGRMRDRWEQGRWGPRPPSSGTGLQNEGRMRAMGRPDATILDRLGDKHELMLLDPNSPEGTTSSPETPGPEPARASGGPTPEGS